MTFDDYWNKQCDAGKALAAAYFYARDAWDFAQAQEREECEIKVVAAGMRRVKSLDLREEVERLRAAAQQAKAALSDLIASGDPKVYGDALRALDAALTPAPTIAIAPVYRSVDDYAAPPTPPASQGTP